ncbi:Sodium/hydrogen exchanger 2 [Dichanthelium oligosanthes]|uniref:Sodium/hydrogen exchanger 2 n=1 Tax=Dichanthelium oligosanthes TaxID=888268 RepID=A0A1E5WD29_9POAL|nr:Sodium/hydrogen exchanger 2 [Dichanthelium oligosanthes]
MGLDLGAILKSGGLAVSDHDAIVSINIFIALLCSCIVIGHLLEGNRWVNESITALVMGLITGGVILLATNGTNSRILVFSEDLFFIYLLPPIIFNAGFQVKKKQFFRNFMTIILFGAVGTLISFVIITLGAMGLFKKLDVGPLELGDYLAIGAIFSATDSVCTLQVLNQDETPLLYSLVFGEGVVNDATSVVLFNAIENLDIGHFDALVLLNFVGKFLYLFFTSTVLGVATGLLSAYIIKKLCFARHSTDREVSIMMLMAYLSYMLSMPHTKNFSLLLAFRKQHDINIFLIISSIFQLLDLSGILTVFFCGIVMSHYTWHNVTESSRVTTKHTFATLSFIAEIFLFLYVGMDALDIEKWKLASSSPKKPIALSAIILGLVMVGRAAFVFPLSFLSNLSKKEARPKISFKQQVIIWWAGLMRGAVSIALAYNKFTASGHTAVRVNAIMITSTVIVVLFSTMVFGLLTKPLLTLLIPPRTGLNTSSLLSSQSMDPLLTSMMGSDFDVGQISPQYNLQYILTAPTRSVHRLWRKFDDRFMRPMFGGRGFVPFVPGSPVERSAPESHLGTVTEADNS